MVWNPFQGRRVNSIATGHNGNIFSVKFMPETRNNLIASGAADFVIELHDMEAQKTVQRYRKHVNRVKRMEVTPTCPNILWSASEDGSIIETDIRSPPEEVGVLINLHADAGPGYEAKCMAINPVFPEYLAVGGTDSYIRMYDRRKLKCHVMQWPETVGEGLNLRERRVHLREEAISEYDWNNQQYAKYFIAGHLPKATKRPKFWGRDNFTSSYVTFSPNGRELLANMGSEQIYLFDVFYGKQIMLESPDFQQFTKNPEGKMESRLCAEMQLDLLELKIQGNKAYEEEKYTKAIRIYNEGLIMSRNHPVLLGNRAAAYIKRNWNGDLYSALLDSYNVIQMDDSNVKAYLRIIKILIELKRFGLANSLVNTFRTKFPSHADAQALKSLEKKLRESDTNPESSEENSSTGFDRITEIEQIVQGLKQTATDFKLRFCGHCNTTTDIKEANFFGSEGQFIIAGSDDGKFFIWDRETTNIVKVLIGDDSIVNCLQPHPTSCLLATSGIDPHVRIWSPRPEECGKDDDREVKDFETTMSANQRRMNADPFESFLMEMGYRVRDMNHDSSENNEADQPGPVQCRTSILKKLLLINFITNFVNCLQPHPKSCPLATTRLDPTIQIYEPCLQ